MDPIDDELKKGLADGPLIRDGFSENLKKRIMERVEEQNVKQKQWMRWCAGICAGIVSIAVFFSMDWHKHLDQEADGFLHHRTAVNETASAPPATSTYEPFQVQSALLIGLRKDYPQAAGSPEYSTYRTVLLAEEEGKLQQIAEGDGILMPYKTDFMKITPQSLVRADGEYRSLTALTASGSAKNREVDAKTAAPLVFSEKLLFAGNRYLSLSQTFLHKDQKKEARYDYVWVKDLQNITPPKQQAVWSPLKEPHIPLIKLYGESAKFQLKAVNTSVPQSPALSTLPVKAVPDENGESWAIVRKQGEWVPQVASYSYRTDQASYGYQLRNIPLELPDSVVSYDRLSASWDEIRQLRPDAKDAFSSPKFDLVGVVTEWDITIFPFDGYIIPAPLLSLSLSPNESVVMLQWAAEEPYISMWKQKGKLLLH